MLFKLVSPGSIIFTLFTDPFCGNRCCWYRESVRRDLLRQWELPPMRETGLVPQKVNVKGLITKLSSICRLKLCEYVDPVLVQKNKYLVPDIPNGFNVKTWLTDCANTSELLRQKKALKSTWVSLILAFCHAKVRNLHGIVKLLDSCTQFSTLKTLPFYRLGMFIKSSLSSVVCQFFTSNKGYGDRHCFLKDWISVLINSVKNYFIFSCALLKNQYIVL